jgi:hypothetical protein
MIDFADITKAGHIVAMLSLESKQNFKFFHRKFRRLSLCPLRPIQSHLLTHLKRKLRLKYYPDRTPPGKSKIPTIEFLKFVFTHHSPSSVWPSGGPYPPEADFANHWNGFIEVNHM